LEEQPNISNSL